MAAAVVLPRSAPEGQGISSRAISAFLDAAELEIQFLHSLMLLRHGTVVAEGWWEPYNRQSPHMLFSLSKSFTSTAIGLLVADGNVSIDESVVALFPDEAPADPDANWRAMRVRHLLTMTTGHDVDPTRPVFESDDWLLAFFKQPVTHAPGTHFVYNTAATHMLSAIVQRRTGQRVVHYLGPRLFEPLGIAPPSWETSPQGIDVGGSGLSLNTEGIARFGQLYLQRGRWQGQQLLPEAWVAEATARQVPNGPSNNIDWVQGYGYQFWRCRHGAYRGDGAFGQFCLVMPEQDAVLAITSGVRNMQRILDLVWEHLLPAMETAALPDNPTAHATLSERLAELRLQPPKGKVDSPHAARVSRGTYRIAPNDDHIETLRLDFRRDGCDVSIGNGQGLQHIPCGFGVWERGVASLERATRRRPGTDDAPWKVAAAGAWTDPDTFVAQLWWYETPFRRTLTCRFDGDRIAVDQTLHVAMGPIERPSLEGRRATEVAAG